MKIIGLTGGIACGKSTAAKAIKDKFGTDVGIIDTDLVNREVVELGKPALKELAESFGPRVLLPDGTLDRAYLAQRVFHPHATIARQTLDDIMTPYMTAAIIRKLVDLAYHHKWFAVIESALLHESRLNVVCDHVMTVESLHQREWLMARNDLTEEEADARIRSQWSRERRMAASDDTIMNVGSEADLKLRVLQTLKSYGLEYR